MDDFRTVKRLSLASDTMVFVKNTRLANVGRLLLITLLFVIFFVTMLSSFQDPIYWQSGTRFSSLTNYAFIIVPVLLFFVFCFVFGVIKVLGRTKGIIFSLFFIGICTLGVGTHWAGLVPELTTASASEVLVFMEGKRQIAITCLNANKDLYSTRSHRGIATMCYQNGSWGVAPSGAGSGWVYRRLHDGNVSDGTFAFSAVSRHGQVIFCTQEKCELQ